MNRGSTFWRKHLSLSRALSTVLSVSMVLSLLPSQGIAEVRREILNANAPEQVESTEAVADDSSGGDATAEETGKASGNTQEEAKSDDKDEAKADDSNKDASDEAKDAESQTSEESAPAEEEPAPAGEEATPEEEPQSEPEVATSNRLEDFITRAELGGGVPNSRTARLWLTRARTSSLV